MAQVPITVSSPGFCSKTPTNWTFPNQVQSTFGKHTRSSKDIDYSTKHVWDVLGLAEKKAGSKPHLLHVLIFFSLDPITSLKDPDALLKAWKGFVECHYHLRQAGLEHGDISVWNLIVRHINTIY
ncbi:hypothetical protein BDQ12DRAFT_718195 [Crucibulum laeve]|uniref:Fungal-type protein kinase domain-containing protein n=1 Tax=Crucibulum laeve TaxID=68775 RepID=A0A5C3MJK3_9AGAR|nr:hypothetical protein BDQ12DRAFT_718195 [Crucibulum laeve]